MSDDLSTVVRRLKEDHSSALVVVHDEHTEHISYWDASAHSLEVAALRYVQQEGFSILDTGKRECGETGQGQEWMEFRRHAPGEGSDGGERRC